MSQEGLPSRLYYRVCCCALFFVAASASFNGFYSKWHFREPGVAFATSSATYGQYGFVDIVDGTASRPFVYRQLLPSIANWFDKTTPGGIKSWLYNLVAEQDPAAAIMSGSPLAQSKTYFFRYFVVYSLTFLFAWLAVFAMYLTCRAVNLPVLTCAFAPVLMILAIPYFMSVGGYFYDYPELAFLALAVWISLRHSWWWLLPLVAVATWNKESFLLMIPTLYPLLRSRYSRIATLVGTGCLCATSVLVYCAVRSRFLKNPGGAVFIEWPAQLRYFLYPMNLMGLESTYGVVAFRAFSVVPLALIAWTVWRGWKGVPETIRQHAKIAAAINIPLYFLLCAPGEMRDLSLLYIAFMLLVAANLAQVERVSRGSKKQNFQVELEAGLTSVGHSLH
jgi:hypothetical protein